MAAERRQIDLDQNTVREGLELYRATEVAGQAWQDWLRERYTAYHLDPNADKVTYNPLTGRISAEIAPRPEPAAGG